MQFMTIYKPSDINGLESGAPPSEEMMTQMGALIAEYFEKGVMVATGGLGPSARGAKVKKADGKVTVKDGPFTETKELIGGFAIFEVPSMAEAIELSRRFLDLAGDGEVEVRWMNGPLITPPAKG